MVYFRSHRKFVSLVVSSKKDAKVIFVASSRQPIDLIASGIIAECHVQVQTFPTLLLLPMVYEHIYVYISMYVCIYVCICVYMFGHKAHLFFHRYLTTLTIPISAYYDSRYIDSIRESIPEENVL